VLFMTVTAFVVARDGVSQGDALAGATFIIAVPFAMMTAVYWRSLRPPPRSDAAASSDEGLAEPVLR
jgi:hypothetical protein